MSSSNVGLETKWVSSPRLSTEVDTEDSATGKMGTGSKDWDQGRYKPWNITGLDVGSTGIPCGGNSGGALAKT